MIDGIELPNQEKIRKRNLQILGNIGSKQEEMKEKLQRVFQENEKTT